MGHVRHKQGLHIFPVAFVVVFVISAPYQNVACANQSNIKAKNVLHNKLYARK